ncbi:probable arginine--tRNA ligase, mitochondrial [Teleopsis dalmanni]|uniref:probable arginine--tRNA ligase, mitochondrial n=1 Tax=Teleopsis dalmanni TaxID=139649 RepID=UPI0018CF2D11|nr:probable arginine--tRNA ligase, mitochondrial [Teleopsis dalmanni]
MSSRIRRAICEKISQITKCDNIYYELDLPIKKQQSLLKNPTLYWKLTGADQQQQEILHALPAISFQQDVVQNVRILPAQDKSSRIVEFLLQPEAFIADLLDEKSRNQSIPQINENVVFEYSSPNIAKPFHVGHLRSTIIGNTLGNLYRQLGYNVTKLNYLGDWGTQFGMLQIGVEMLNVTSEQMKTEPIATLYNAYVAANTAAKTDPNITEKARRCFNELEIGTNSETTQQWQLYREYTIAELDRMYARLGVKFDFYDWESQYSQQQISSILKSLSEKSLLLNEQDGRKVVQVDDRRVPLIKSDGSTLYLARDIAALIDRFKRFQFNNIFYVVDSAQTDHFNACFKTTAALCPDISLSKLRHIKFGRILGMSTRSGNAVFLRDVLDEARDIMHEKQLKSTTTKVNISITNDDKLVSDALGVSAVIINDLKQRRQRDYEFNWEKALQVNGDTGIKLQYTHCRLSSLLENMADINTIDAIPNLHYLQEPIAEELLYEIARCDRVLWLTKEHLEPCILVNYLFSLCNTTSRALKLLNIKSETCTSKQQNRILLFRAAKHTLNKGMKILGLNPLNKM